MRFESIAGPGIVLAEGGVLDVFENVHFENVVGVPVRLPIDQAGKLEGVTGTDLDISWIELEGDHLSTSQTWRKQGIPYYYGGRADITGSLDLAAGVTLLMGKDSSFTVKQGGSLKTQGTADSRVVIQGSEPNSGPGVWDSITVMTSEITGSELGESRIELIGGSVRTSQTWKKLEIPYYIGSFSSIERSTLEIAAGTTVLMGPGIALELRNEGSLKTLGTTESHVTIKSSKSGPSTGDWKYIGIYATASKDSVFNYTDIHHGGGSGYGSIYVEKGAEVALNHVTFTDSEGCDVDELGTVTSDETTFVQCD